MKTYARVAQRLAGPQCGSSLPLALALPLALGVGSLALIGVTGCQPPSEPAVEEAPTLAAPQTDEERAAYAMGVALARGVEPLVLEDALIEQLMVGLQDAIHGRELAVSAEEGQTLIPVFVRSRQAAAAGAEKEAGAEFLASAAAMEGAEQTDSGLIIRITDAGDGPMPGADSQVKVHYHGTLRDGTVFDSSVERGEPATFPLDRVIPCWTEAMQKLPVGSKAVITCPSDIAYGDRGNPRIPPGSSLAFEVELIEIVE